MMSYVLDLERSVGMFQRVFENDIARVIIMEALKTDLAIVTITLPALQPISYSFQQLAAVRPI